MALHRNLACLPDELLLAVAAGLDQASLARWAAAAHRFYRLLVPLLYRRDRLAGRPAFFWGCRTGNLQTLGRAVDAGEASDGDDDEDDDDDNVLAAALGGDDPLAVVSFLLDRGVVSANATTTTTTTTTFWPVLARVLEAAGRAPRWCPVPVVACFLAHGARLRGDSDGDGDDDESAVAGEALRVWPAVLALPQVRGPRQRWVLALGGTTASSAARPPFALRYDHCQHADASCAVAVARLLLRHGADPYVRGCMDASSTTSTTTSTTTTSTSLAALAMAHPRRPVELLQCLAEAEAANGGTSTSTSSTSRCRRRRRRCSPVVARRPLLDAALADALRLASLRRLPRGRHWDCYPAEDAVQCRQPDAVIRFLLQRGALGRDDGEGPLDDGRRTRALLDRWDPQWRRFVGVRRRGAEQQQQTKKTRRRWEQGR